MVSLFAATPPLLLIGAVGVSVHAAMMPILPSRIARRRTGAERDIRGSKGVDVPYLPVRRLGHRYA